MYVDLSLNEAEARSLHLAFALLLAGLLGAGPRWLRAALALAGALAAGYIVARYSELAQRPGQATSVELALSAGGLGLLLIAAWRCVSRALALLGAAALVVVVLANGAPLDAMAQLWLSPRGVFGPPLGLCAQFLFLATVLAMLLVAWGAVARWAALLDRLGATQPALALFGGRLLAGLATPGARAALAAGGETSTAGRWGAVALAAAVLSQAVPPLLGYTLAVMPGALRTGTGTVLAAVATIGALALGGALLTLGLGASAPRVRLARLAGWIAGLGLLALTGAGLLGGYLQAKAAYGGVVSWLAGGATALLYGALHWHELRRPPDATARLAIAALRGALPLLVLVWGVLVEGLDPALVVFWAVGFSVFVIALGALFDARWGTPRRGAGAALGEAARTIARGIVLGVEQAVPLAIAAAVAGLLIAAALALGVPSLLTRALDWTTGAGALGAVLGLGALAAGLGALLPTVPAYLVVSALLVPVLLDLGVRGGAAMPLLAAHLCLLYGAIAGAALGLARPLAARMIVPLIALALALPFNGALLGPFDTIECWWALAGAALGTVVLARLLAPAWRAALTRGEAIALAVVVASLLAPRLWLDAWSPATAPVDARRLVAIAGSLPPDAGVAVVVDEDSGLAGRSGRPRAMTLPLGAPGGGAERLASAGIELRQEGELVKLARVGPASWADRNGLRRGTAILMVRAPVAQPSLGFVLVPAAALGLLVLRRRARRLHREQGDDENA